MENKFEEIYVKAPWGNLCVVCCGPKDGPAILLLHGNQDSAATFYPLIKYFPKQFRLHILELPGCGKSSHLPGTQPIYLYDYIYSLKLTIDHFKLNNLIFIGHSMGNQIGLHYNAIYPGNIIKIVALDSVAYEPIESEHFAMWYTMTYDNYYEPYIYKKMSSGPENNPKYTYEKALALVMSNRELTKEAGEVVLQRTLIPVGDGLYKFCWDQRMKIISLPPLDSQYQLDLYGNLKIPHITILSTDSVNKKIQNAKLHVLESHISNNPNYRVVMIEGNHDVHLNKPADVAKYVVPFLLGQDTAKAESDQLVRDFKIKLSLQLNENVKSKL